MTNLVVRSVAVGVVALAGSIASAQICTSAAAFQAAIGNDSGQFLDTCTVNTTTATGGTPAMTHTYSAASGLYHGTSSGGFMGTSVTGDSFTVTFTTGNVYAVGGEWFNCDFSDVFVPNVTITLTYSNGVTDTYVPQSFNDFHGYVSPVPLTSVVMTYTGTASYSGTGSLITSSAPTPGAAAALGLGGLAALRRRRR